MIGHETVNINRVANPIFLFFEGINYFIIKTIVNKNGLFI